MQSQFWPEEGDAWSLLGVVEAFAFVLTATGKGSCLFHSPHQGTNWWA